MELKGIPKEYLAGLKVKPPVTIRVNTLKITKQELRDKLVKKGFELMDHPVHEQALKILRQPFSIGATTEYLLGYYMLQDAASMIAVRELKPRPGNYVLDMCAGSGAKTTHISELMNNKGVIIACDNNKKRLLSVKYNAQRMGCENIIGLNTDSRKINNLGIKFDRVLLDPPCTALGIIYKSPGLLNKELPIKRLKKLQVELIEAGIKSLKSRGVLVYSTCTVTMQENEEVAKHALSQGMKLEHMKRYYPHINETQGFFIAKMVKS